MKLEDIMNFLEKKYNPELAEKWDNSGLIVGRKESNISAIIVCLDVTADVIARALFAGQEAHHFQGPYGFSETVSAYVELLCKFAFGRKPVTENEFSCKQIFF